MDSEFEWILAQGVDLPPLPEPPTILLMGLAALVPALVALWLRRKKRQER